MTVTGVQVSPTRASTSCTTTPSPALTWGGWLVRHNRGREAGEVVARARTALTDEDKKADFERRWQRLMDGDSDDKSSDKVMDADTKEDSDEESSNEDEEQEEDDVDMLVVS